MGKRGNGEGSVYQRKDGRWVGQYLVYLPSGPKYRYIYAKTRKAGGRETHEGHGGSRRRYRRRRREA